MDELAGTVIGGRYRLDQKLGEGGMGVVYSAFQLDLGRAVAIKLMTHTTPEGLLRFQREAHTAASLGNPHIVQVFDFHAAGDEPAFLVMELLNGPSLRQLVKQSGPLAPERAAHLFVQVLSALDAAHRAGIVHRDMKPANIVITSTPTLGEVAKVLDFGIAKLTNPSAPALTQDGDIVGTMAYMSPEQAGGGLVDARSDIYSLGATLFHALSGQRPVEARSADELYLGIVEGRTRPLGSLRADIDARLAVIVDRALALDPTARFASAHEMADALAGWVQQRVLTSVPPASAQPTSMPPAAFYPTHPPIAPRKKSSGLGMVMLLVSGFFALVLFAGVIGGAYYFFILEEQVPATASTSGTDAGTSSPATAGSASPLATTPSMDGTSKAPVAAQTTKGAPASPAATNASDAATPPATPASTKPAPGGCKNSADCGPGAWSCSNDKCVCPSHLTMCGSVCTNLSFDGSNCGACGKTCSGNDVCLSAFCQSCSPPTRMLCGGVCKLIGNDITNCGGCGIKCAPGKLCVQGACAK